MAVVCLAKCLPKCLPSSHPHLTTVLILEAICQLYILSLDPLALKGDHVLHSIERNVGGNTNRGVIFMKKTKKDNASLNRSPLSFFL